MNAINTSSQSIQVAKDICKITIKTLRTTQKDLLRDFEEAGREWNDSKYHRLGAIIGECNSSFDKVLVELDDCLAPLKAMEISIREYNEVNFRGTSSASNGTSTNAGSHTPINNGEWSGERGNSMWRPTNKAVINDLQFYGDGVEGIEYRNGYADFSPVKVYECRLHNQLYYRDDEYQFVDCTMELREHLRAYPNTYVMSYFDDTQLSAIARGQARIPGYTWHHDVQAGLIQLVPTSIHSTCPHYGGQSIWGGGSINR